MHWRQSSNLSGVKNILYDLHTIAVCTEPTNGVFEIHYQTQAQFLRGYDYLR